MPTRAVLELGIPDHPRHSRVSIVFSAPEAEVGPVVVDVQAEWSPTLDYETYTSTVREVLQPLLKRYNRAYGTRLRPGIPGPERPVQLPHKAGELLRRYLGRTTRGYAHPLDWGQFYDFVIHCHERRVRAEGLKELLLAQGVPDETAIELEEVYMHGRSLLKRRIAPGWLM